MTWNLFQTDKYLKKWIYKFDCIDTLLRSQNIKHGGFQTFERAWLSCIFFEAVSWWIKRMNQDFHNVSDFESIFPQRNRSEIENLFRN